MISVKEHSEATGLSERQIWDLVTRGRLESYTVGYRRYICPGQEHVRPRPHKKRRVDPFELADLPGEWVNAADAAGILGITAQAVRDRVSRGWYKAAYPSGIMHVSVEEIEKSARGKWERPVKVDARKERGCSKCGRPTKNRMLCNDCYSGNSGSECDAWHGVIM